MESSVAATSSMSPPVVLPTGNYEVFMSFRGPDVRNRFADHLYTSLADAKIRTFRDEEELHKGEGIAPSLTLAIPDSKIYIPILTEQYASSKWCLLELAQMVKCWKQGKGHLILPIFYSVNPRDVRHQKGPYQQAFEQHAHEHSLQTVNEWREALREVGQMKGWHVTEFHREGAIVHEVLSEVESHLRSMYTLVTDELVGIDNLVEEVMELLNLRSSNEKFTIGIHGMGGLGKTTISKVVYNKICVQFDRCCYLEDVREALAKNDGAVSLQNKVISTILKSDYRVKNLSEGINTIKDRVCKHKLLLVVDNIDHKFEFDKILGKLGDFSRDSRFIFTTRDKRTLDFIPNCKLYEPKEMSPHLSLQLFSKHAFGMDNPPEEDAIICEKFVKVAGGLPLALKVMGSLLFRRERKFWEEKLIELQGIPSTTDNMVQERLKISYNDLSYKEKQIFLDIACFFIGSHKDLPYYMWSGCDFYPENGINTLIHRSLIKLDEENQFWMHDHIKDLGRAIVNEEDIRHPYNRSRIWSTDDVLNMLRNREGSEWVEAVRIVVKSRDDDKLLKSENFEKLSGLRYLEVQFGDMRGDFSQVLPNICCLRLLHCESIPTNVNAKKLVVLDLEGSNVKDNWKGWSEVKAGAKLKAVNLSNCYNLKKSPDLSTCTNLEFINFAGCYKMKGQMHIDKFKNLKTVNLQRTHIKGLVISGGDIGKLQGLEEMDLSGTDLRELPAGIENLSSLKILSLGSSYWRIEMPSRLPGSLKRLSISSSSGVPTLANLCNLTGLDLSNIQVAEIPGLGELRALETMEIRFLKLNNLNGLENLLLLKTLNLYDTQLERLPSLASLRKLKVLKVTSCPDLVEIQGLGGLGESLSCLEIRNCPRLTNLDGVQLLRALEELILEEQPLGGKTTSLDLSGLVNLKRLHIVHCPELTEVKGLERLVSLECLSMWNCASIRQLPDLSELINLKGLELSCDGLIDLVGVDRLDSLRRLELRECHSIRNLPNLSGLKNLETLNLEGCIELTEVEGVEGLESLTELNLRDCRSITELGNLSGLKKLQMCDIVGCTKLIEVNGLDELEELEHLRMGKRMRAKYLAKSAARLAARLVDRSPTHDAGTRSS